VGGTTSSNTTLLTSCCEWSGPPYNKMTMVTRVVIYSEVRDRVGAYTSRASLYYNQSKLENSQWLLLGEIYSPYTHTEDHQT